MARLCRQAGYSGTIVTDHYLPRARSVMKAQAAPLGYLDHYFSGNRAAKSEGDRIGLEVLWGLELTFRREDSGDYLVYGLPLEFLKEHTDLDTLTLAAFRRLTQDLGLEVLVFQAHPFRPGMATAPPELLDGVEVFNGNPRHESENHRLALKTHKHIPKALLPKDHCRSAQRHTE